MDSIKEVRHCMKTTKKTKKTNVHNDNRIIAYYRVSTKAQGQNGLGIQAQKEQVRIWLQQNPGTLIAEYTEVESGKKSQRPILQKAIEECRTKCATLLVAKIDRLSRNCAFLFALVDSGIKIQACDIPTFNTLTLAIYAGLAQQERELISERTKAALAALKASGRKLGNPNGKFTRQDVEKSAKVRRDAARARKENQTAYAFIMELRKTGLSLRKIAEKLNENGYRTVRGKEYKLGSIQSVLKIFSK